MNPTIEAIQTFLSTTKSKFSGVRVIPMMRCKNGIELSVQASEHHYCEPRSNIGPWSKVEIGYPSARIEALMEYAEEPDNPTDTVYGYVPISVLAAVIDEAGGIDA